MSGPSQPKVTNEEWSDQRVLSFLCLEPARGISADYHALEAAYRHMRATDFERFLKFFSEAGRNLDARDPRGRTLWDVISAHRHGTAFIEARQKQD